MAHPEFIRPLLTHFPAEGPEFAAFCGATRSSTLTRSLRVSESPTAVDCVVCHGLRGA